jgi:hypothetical protein
MKSKLLLILSTSLMALALLAQSATQTTPPPAGDQAKTCACCNHDKADGKMTCCGKDGRCCKDGKCDMMSKDGKGAMTHEHMTSGDDKAADKCPMMAKDGQMACCGKGGCCKNGKCDMAKDGKSCCDGKQCARPQKGA